MLLIQQIEKIAHESKGSKQEIANFIISNSNDLHKYTIEKIAQDTYTSKASVVRFAKSLNCPGWREFISSFSKEQLFLSQQQKQIDANFPFDKDDSFTKVADQLKKLEIQTLETSRYLIDQEQFEQAAQIINSSKRVCFYAESPNNYLAQLFRRKLLSIGIRGIVFNDDEAGLETGAMTPDDCAIIISYSGAQASRAIRHVNLLKANHIPIIGISSDTDNFLRHKADIYLKIASEENLYTKITSFQTEISINYILNLLFALVFQQNYDSNQYYHLDSARYLESKRENNQLKQ